MEDGFDKDMALKNFKKQNVLIGLILLSNFIISSIVYHYILNH